MDYGFKKITSLTLLILSSVSFTCSANGSFTSDANKLAQCRSLVDAKIGEVDRIKVAKIKSKARSFTVKFKIADEGERSVVQCKLARDEVASISCLKGNACNREAVASESK